MAFSVMRMSQTGFLPLIFIQLISVSLFWLSYLLKDKLSYLVKSYFVISIILIIGLLGIVQFGIIASAGIVLVFALLLSALLLEAKAVYIMTAVVLTIYLLGFIAHSSGIVGGEVDANQYGLNFAAWAMEAFLVFCVSISCFILINQIKTQYDTFLKNADKKIEGANLQLEQANNELVESNSLLQAVLDTIPARVFWKDAQSNFLGANQAFANDAGVSDAAYVVGKSDYDMPWFEEADLYREDDQDVIQNLKEKIKIDEPQTKPDGSLGWIRTTKVPLKDHKGDVIGLLGTYEDVTKEKRSIEELSIAKLKAESANQTKSQFLANMSHEVRTPLNGILGMTQLILETNLDAQQADYLVKIKLSANHLLAVINDILDFSKIEAGKLEIESTPFSLDQVFKQLEASLGLQAKEKGLELKLESIVALDKIFVGDPLRIGQILNNLTSNALKFTQAGSVRVELVKAELKSGLYHLKFTVSDTGIGISEDNIKNLFSAFNQLDASTCRKYGGTGLGLAISKRLANLMSGDLTCRSELGKGSQFDFELVVLESTAAQYKSFHQQDRGGLKLNLSGKSILLAEDNEINQEVVLAILAGLNAKVSLACDGTEAVRKALDNPPDIILMDIQMPNLDGIGATQQIKQVLPNIPIIALTANVMKQDFLEYQKQGMVDCIAKPIVVKEFYSVLAKYT